MVLQVKKPTFEEVKSIHTRLATVTFQPRGSVDDDAAPPPALSSVLPVESSIRKVGKSHETVPVLPFNKSSKSLFAACMSGDASKVAAALQDITENDLNRFRVTDEVLVADGNGSGSCSSSDMGSSGKNDSNLDGEGESSGSCQSKNLPDIQEEGEEEEEAVGLEGTGEDTEIEMEGGIDREEEEEVLLDLKGVLDMPDSLEGLSTCLHLASEKGLSLSVSLSVCLSLSVFLILWLRVMVFK